MKINDIFSSLNNTKKFIEACSLQTITYKALKDQNVIDFKEYLLKYFVEFIGFDNLLFKNDLSQSEIETLESFRNNKPDELLEILQSLPVSSKVQPIFNLLSEVLDSPDIVFKGQTVIFEHMADVGIQLPVIHNLFAEIRWAIFIGRDGSYFESAGFDINIIGSSLHQILAKASQLESSLKEFPQVFEVVSAMLEYQPRQLRIKQTSPLITEYKITAPDGDSFILALDQNFKPAFIDDVEVERVPNLDWSQWLNKLANHIYNKS